MRYLTMVSRLTAILQIFHFPDYPQLLLQVTKIPWRPHRSLLPPLLLGVGMLVQGRFSVHHLLLASGSFHHHQAVRLALVIFQLSR